MFGSSKWTVSVHVSLYFVIHIDDECSEVISDLLECDIPSMSPSKVCLRCYQENYKAGWLSYLKCTQPSMHVNADTITVVTRETNDDQQLVPLRSAQHLGCLSNGKIELCPHKPCHCPKKDKCLLAHSEEELNYWRWEKAKVILVSNKLHVSAI